MCGINKLYIQTQHKNKGFGLVEILFAMAIMAVGIVAVSKLQTDSVGLSVENKARNEANGIAQQRLESMKNYTKDVETLEDFQTRFASTNNANSTSMDGAYATFTRTETIVDSGDARTVTINVSWNDASGALQSINLVNEIAFKKPRSVADMGQDFSLPTVVSPTGKAVYVKGTIPPGTVTSDNADNTQIYIDGNDKILAFGTKNVLKLEEACELGTCSDFVKISGTVYLDDDSTKSADQIFVQASDAAFCVRYFPAPSPATGNLNVTSGNASSIPKTSDPLTDQSYQWFNYTCYLGGGWHGNIGLLFEGNIGQVKSCVGDPLDQKYLENQPIMTARRIYRGQVQKIDENGDVVLVNGKPILASIGIADSAIIPAAGEHGHDFVVTRKNSVDHELKWSTNIGHKLRGNFHKLPLQQQA